MRSFTVLLSPDASSDLDRLREEGRWQVIEAVGKMLHRLERLPESGGCDRFRRRWSLTRRKVILGKTGYILRYRLHLKTELIEVRSVRHQSQKPMAR
jgi:plasmid stabilization system protein ParE